MLNQDSSLLVINPETESHLESDVTIPADSFVLQDSFADPESQEASLVNNNSLPMVLQYSKSLLLMIVIPSYLL